MVPQRPSNDALHELENDMASDVSEKLNDRASPTPLPSPAHHIVLVDDDPLFLQTFAANMEDAGYRVSIYENARTALAALLNDDPPTACILDWHMPDMNGLELLRQLKTVSFSAPIMFLTGLHHPLFEEVAFDQGAIEFVEKTRSLPVILKRLERMIAENQDRPARGNEASGGLITEIGNLSLNHHTKRALWKGTQVSLSLSEFEVVALLVKHAGSDVSYRQIYDIIQDTGFLGGRGPEGYRTNVRAAIKRIRKKFSVIDAEFDALENYPGFGYRWRQL
jgi:two-component system response regulator ChvI